MLLVRRTFWFVLSMSWLIAGVWVQAADSKLMLPPETAKLKEGPGAELATANCLLCHSADYISTQPRLSRAGWKASVEKMRQKYGAPMAPDKIEPLLDYLVKNYGQDGLTNRSARPK